MSVEPGMPLRAVGGGRWVSAVHVEADTAVHEGDVVYALDGIDVIAAATAFPIGQELSVGSIGPDVEQLEQLLVRLELFDGDPDRSYTDATAAAVRQLGDRLSAPPTWRFQPQWLAHIPQSAVGIAAVDIIAGAPALGMGQTWGRTPSQITSASLSVTNDQSFGMAEALVATAGTTTVEVTMLEDGSLAPAPGQDGQLAALAERFTMEVATSDAGGGDDPDNQSSDAPASGELSIPVLLSPTEDIDIVVLPVQAVVTDNLGATCVALVEEDSVDWTPATVVGSQPGVGAYLDPATVPQDALVALDPTVPNSLRC